MSSCFGGAHRRGRRGRASCRGTPCSRRATGHSGAVADTGAEDPAFILATSGTTAKPKLAVHTHGGYAVHDRGDGRLGVRPPRGRDLVVDVRHRLGRRPQLHRLRAADGRCHDARLRGCDRPPRSACCVGDHRARARDRRVLVADRHPAAHAVRRGHPEAPRPEQPRAPLLGRRGAERAGLGVAPALGVRRPHSRHRPHVADRDRRPDLRQPVRARHRSRSSRGPPASRCPESRPTSWTRTVSRSASGEKGVHADQAAVPRPDRRRSGASPSGTSPTTGRRSRAATTSAMPRTSTRTATSGSPAERTRSSRSPTTGSGRSRSRPRSCAIPRSPRRA